MQNRATTETKDQPVPMQLDGALQLAQHQMRHTEQGSDGERLAEWVIDVLGEAQPSMMEPLRVVVVSPGEAGVLLRDDEDPMTVDEARAYAVLILRAADQAEEQNR